MTSKTLFSSPAVAARTLGLVVALSGCAAAANGETILLRSGQVGGFPGLVGQFDSTMTFGPTVSSGPLSASPFVAADFNASASGSAALCITPYSAWLPALTFDPQARWVGTGNAGFPAPDIYGASSSTLYCVPFTVTTTGITSAVISLSWACDDDLGDLASWGGPNPIGAYLRDSFGSITALTPMQGGGYGVETIVLNYNILGAISTGNNQLFLYQRDQGAGISGLIFGAEIVITPTPGAAAVLGLGALAGMRRKR